MLILAAGAFCALLVLRLLANGDDQVGSALNVTVIIDGYRYDLTTNALTVRQLLRSQAITDYEGLAITPPLDSALAAGLTITVDEERSVSLTVDGLTSVFRTIIDHPNDILANAGVSLAPGDSVEVNGLRIPTSRLPDYPLPANTITVRRALTVTIEIDRTPLQFRTTATTVGEALADAGVTLYLGDDVDPAPGTPLSDAMTILVERSTPVSIQADGVTIETRAQGQTVGDALIAAGVALVGLDYAVPSEVASLQPGMTIAVVRVREELLTEDLPVPFETIYQADAERDLDQTAVIQEGEPGLDQRTVRVRFEDGREVRRSDEGTTRAREPRPRIIAYGTRIALRTVDTPEGPREYWRVLRLYATSYHPAALGGDDVTSIGRKLQKGIVAIDPRLIPYDTSVYVPGYGIGVAADTGGPRRSQYWIDLGYSDADWESWSRWVDVYLLTPPPANIPYVLP